MAIPVKLEVFEGPLDLLLHLIEKNKIDIYDIPINEITDQYLDYIREMEKEDMDVTSEFMVMAATLLDIKCRMLLPDDEESEEEEDPREELVRRILEYKTIKAMSVELRESLNETGLVVTRDPDIPKSVLKYRPPVDAQELLDAVTLEGLYKVYQEILARHRESINTEHQNFGKIEKEKVSLHDQIIDLEKKVIRKRKMSFREYLEDQPSRLKVVVTFLAVLELMHRGRIRIIQEKNFGEICIESLENEDTVVDNIDVPDDKEYD